MATIAVDLGGTRIKIALVENGVVLAERAIPAHSNEPVQGNLNRVRDTVEMLFAETSMTPPRGSERSTRFTHAAFALPVLIDKRSRIFRSMPGKHEDLTWNLLEEWTYSTWRLPLCVEVDSNAALIGESRYGTGTRYADAVMVTLGTGIGTAAMVGGALVRGHSGRAGVLGGHAIVHAGGASCLCGRVGCAEAETSLKVVSELAVRDRRYPSSLLARSTSQPVDYKVIFAAAAAGDSLAIDLRDRSIDIWSIVAQNMVNAYDARLVILCGGIMASAEIIVDRVRAVVTQGTWFGSGAVEVEPGNLGDMAAVIGVAALAEEQGVGQDYID